MAGSSMSSSRSSVEVQRSKFYGTRTTLLSNHNFVSTTSVDQQPSWSTTLHQKDGIFKSFSFHGPFHSTSATSISNLQQHSSPLLVQQKLKHVHDEEQPEMMNTTRNLLEIRKDMKRKAIDSDLDLDLSLKLTTPLSNNNESDGRHYSDNNEIDSNLSLSLHSSSSPKLRRLNKEEKHHHDDQSHGKLRRRASTLDLTI